VTALPQHGRQHMRQKGHSSARYRARPTLESLESRWLLSAGFVQINLDSDIPGLALHTDPNLVNPWGVSFSPTGPFWLGENGSGVSELLDGRGQMIPLVVNIPSDNQGGGSPTGTVFNSGPGFEITDNGLSGPGIFLFDTEDGTIAAWNPLVDPTHAVVAVDNSDVGAVYKGLALAATPDGQTFLYAADFSRGTIDVFDEHFQPVSNPGAFEDPNLPAEYAPFNVENIHNLLYVTYAQQDASRYDDVPGAGHGFIDVYRTDGTLVGRFTSGGALNSPWGMALAPSNFGPFSGDLLVGNTGDGHINAFDPHTGAFLGTLTDANGNTIAIPHLWGLTFGNGHLAGATDTLFFSAGVNDENDGLFGAIQFSWTGRAGSTAGDSIFNPNAPGEAEDYPLPPAGGPTLQSNQGDTTHPVVLLLPVGDSAIVLAPTLSTGVQSGSESPGTPAELSTSMGPASMTFASLGTTGTTASRTDPHAGGSASSKPLSLTAFLDVNPQRRTTAERPGESLPPDAGAATLSRGSAVVDPVPRGTVVKSQAGEELVRADKVEIAATTPVEADSTSTADLSRATVEKAALSPDGTLLSWLRKLSLPLGVLLVWNGLHRCLPGSGHVGRESNRK
jgi:uncharacterized protein (TIGR03118 family)